MGKPKKPDTSKQDALLAQQQKKAEEARLAAEAEASALRDERISKQKAARGRLSGRRSLIATSELGVKENLG
jgi:hypothetical protein